MSETLATSARKVQEALDDHGLSHTVVQFSESTRTAAEAAAAIGCDVEQIAKTLVFMTTDTYEPIIVIACGSTRVNEAKISEVVSHPVRKAHAAFVLEKTGYAIGGIPPIGHATQITTLIDQGLLKLSEIWAAAGTPHAVFRLTPDDLVRLTAGQVASVQ